jgi:cytochrome c peroxidase
MKPFSGRPLLRIHAVLAAGLALAAAAACGSPSDQGGTSSPLVPAPDAAPMAPTQAASPDAAAMGPTPADAAAMAPTQADAAPIDPTLAALSPARLPGAPPDISNRFADDPRAAKLGQALFFDTSFSGVLLDPDNDGSPSTLGKAGQSGKVACAGCHVPESGFLDSRSPGQDVSLAAGWGLRKAPSLLDVGQAKLLTWGGRHDALYNQVLGPIESPVEMNSSRLYAAEQLAKNYRAPYEAIFGPMPAFDDPTRFPGLAANVTGCAPRYGVPQPSCGDPCDGKFHGMPGDGAEFDGLAADDQKAVNLAVVNMGKAIGAYERLLTCGQSRFDRWIGGDKTALSASEQAGAALFVGKGRCVSCHSGPYLSDQQFHDVGLGPKPVGVVFADLSDKGASAGVAAAINDPFNTRGVYSDGDDGRLPASVAPSMTLAFKTPMLRCAGMRPSFMHTAQIRTLAQVVDFFNRGGDGPGIGGKNELQPLGLTADEEQSLVDFLNALTGPGPDPSLLSAPTN